MVKRTVEGGVDEDVKHIRNLQEKAMAGLLGAIADSNNFYDSCIGGTIEYTAEPGQQFDSFLTGS